MFGEGFLEKYCFDLHGVWTIGKGGLNTSRITPSKLKQNKFCGLRLQKPKRLGKITHKIFENFLRFGKIGQPHLEDTHIDLFL